MDIVTAIGTYEEYVFTMGEMMIAQEKEEEDIVNKWNDLEVVAKEMFKKVIETEEKLNWIKIRINVYSKNEGLINVNGQYIFGMK